MGLFPKSLGDLQRFDVEVTPPGHLIAGLMQLLVMTAAEGNGELVADFKSDSSRLRKPKVMRGGGCRPQMRQGCDATNFRCALSRRRLGSAMARTLLSIRPGMRSGSAFGASGGASDVGGTMVRSA